MEQLIKVENGVVAITEEVLQEFHDFQILVDKMKVKEEEVKEALLKAMQENGVKSFENNFVKVTYKAPYVKKTVDTKALKDQGLYESFVKESHCKASVSISWK